MRSLSFFRLTVIIILICAAIPNIVAQQQNKDNGFVPEVGQPGKDVVWVPTPQTLVDIMLEIADVKPGDFVIDLGSGDGRTVISAAKLGARAVGVEFNPDMIVLSRINAIKEGVQDKVEFIEGDLFETDLSEATVITMFLLPEINLRLRPHLLDLKAGTRIVSNTFSMGEWIADLKVTTDENWNSWNTALLWIVPAKVEGTWKFQKGELSLTQNYQMVSGSYKTDGKSYEITDGRLRGDIISFNINGEKYTGKVNENMISGTVINIMNSSKSNWISTR